MVVKLGIPQIRYEVESLTRMLLGETPVTIVLPDETAPAGKDIITVTEEPTEDGVMCCVRAFFDGRMQEGTRRCTDDPVEKEQTVCRLIYDQLTALLGAQPAMGHADRCAPGEVGAPNDRSRIGGSGDCPKINRLWCQQGALAAFTGYVEKPKSDH